MKKLKLRVFTLILPGQLRIYQNSPRINSVYEKLLKMQEMKYKKIYKTYEKLSKIIKIYVKKRYY